MLKVDDEQVRKIEGILKKEAEEPQALWQIDHGLSQLGHGIALIDFDNDGWQDIYVTGHGRWFAGGTDRLDGKTVWQNQLYRNIGDGRFEHIRTANNRLLMDVLTDEQKNILLDWVGKPYDSPSWQELWTHYAK
jgi:hypothetical protein